MILNAFITFSAQSKKSEVPIIKLKGSPYERGLQHGSILKKEIGEVFTKWKISVKEETKKEADLVIADFLKTSKYKESILKWTPDIYEEIKGIAKGSGQSFDDVLAFQMIDEYWGYLDRLKHNSVDKDHCSAIGIAKTKNQPTIVAENIDIDNYMNGYQVLLHIKGDKNTPDQLVMTCAGYLGFAGMNKNLALVINAMTDVNNSVSGLPVPFVTRGILSKKSGKEAIDFIKNIKHATGQNYLIGTEKEVFTFEVSANDIEEYKPFGNNLLVYHTNHSLNNHDIKPWMQELHKMAISGGNRRSNSMMRLSSLESQIKNYNKDLDQEKIKSILKSKEDPRAPICVSFRENGNAFTFSSVIFTLGKKPYAEFTKGSPDANSYQKYHLD